MGIKIQSDLDLQGSIYLKDYLYHSGDTNTYIKFDADRIRLIVGGTTKFDSNSSYLSSVNNGNWSGTDLAIANGGTGASTASAARTNLGLGTAATSDSGDFATASHNHDSSYLGISAKAADSDLLDGISSASFLRSDANDTFTGALTIDGYIKGNGQQLVLNAGESHSYATGQTGEYIYMNAEQGLQINSETGNWSGGWAARKTAYLRGDQLTLDSETLTKTNIQNFKTAYGWGNHSSAGYLTSINNGNWSGTDLAIANGGTGASSASGARTNLGLGSLATLNTVNASTITDNSVGAAEINVSGNGSSGQVLTSDGDGTMSWTNKTTNTDTVTSVGTSGSEVTGTVTLTAAGATTLSQTGNSIEIRSTDTNTTYSVGDGGLTQKNFTTTLKNKLDGIASGAEVNVQSDWNATSGDALILNKPTIPTNNNQLTNGAGYITSFDITTQTDSKYLRSNADDVTTGTLTIGDGSNQARLILKKADNNTSNHIEFYNGTTRVGEIGAEDTSWLRINQETAKNIYTPRYIRADSGFFVDGTSKGINGSGNFIGGTIAGASDANVSNWDTAYGWGNHASAGYSTAAGVEDNADVTDTTNVVAALTAGTNITIAANGTISATDTNTTYSTATSSTLGLVKIGYSENGKNYPVELSSGKMFVNVPWTDTNTTYSVGDGGLTQKNFTTTLKNKLDGIAASADAYGGWNISDGTNSEKIQANNTLTVQGGGSASVSYDSGNNTLTINATDTNTTYSVGDGGLTQKNFTTTLKNKLDGIAASANNYSLPAGSSTVRGGFKIGYSENGKNYPVEVSSEKMFVNVPWTDTNTNTITSVGVSGSETTGTVTFAASGSASISQVGSTVTISATNTTYSEYNGNSAGLVPSGNGNAGYFLMEDGSWAVPQDTNTTYSAGAGLDLSGTTFSVEGNLSGDVYAIGRDGNDKYVVNTTNHAWYLDGVLDMRLNNNGNLDVDGDVIAYSTVTSSDRRLKTDIETLENASDKVKSLRGVSFTWDHGKKAGKKDIGLIAQEVEEVVPEIVGESELLDGTMAKHVDYPKLVALLIESNKELIDRIETLEAKIDGLTK